MKTLNLKYDIKTLELRKELRTIDRNGLAFEQCIQRQQKLLQFLKAKLDILVFGHDEETSVTNPEIEKLKKDISNLTCDLKTLALNKDPKSEDRQMVNWYLNRYFREYNKKKGYKDSARMENDFFQPVIDQDPGILSSKEWFTLQTVKSYTDVVPAMPLSDYEKAIKDVIEKANKHSLTCMENHSMFAGPLVLIAELQKYAKRFSLPLPKIHISLSGALLTQTQGKVGVRPATLIQTLANTENSKDIKLPRWALAEIRGNYKNTLTELLSVPGNLVWVAPTASTDIIQRADDGTATDIYFGDDSVPNVASFLNMLKELSQANDTPVALLGLNGSNMKDPLGINDLKKTRIDANKEIARTIGNVNEKNHNRAPGNTFCALEVLSSQEIIDRIEKKIVMSSIASNVRNREGNPIGHAVDQQTLKELAPKIKAETERQKFFFESDKGPASMADFDDARYRKAIRTIFEAGKDYQRLGLQKLILRILKKSACR